MHKKGTAVMRRSKDYDVKNGSGDGGIELGEVSVGKQEVDSDDDGSEDETENVENAFLLSEGAAPVSKYPSSSKKKAALTIDTDGEHGLVAGEHLASTPKMIGNIFVSFVGAGILGLPHAFKRAGVVEGSIILILVYIISVYAMILLVTCKRFLKDKNVSTFGDIAFHAMGAPGAMLVDCCLIVTQTGFSCAYLIFISTNLHQLFGIPKLWVVVGCVPVLSVLALTRHLGSLAPFSLFADVANVVGLIAVYWADMSALTPEVEAQVVGARFAEIPYFFGVAIYCYEGVGMILPLEASAKDKGGYISLLVAVTVAVTLMYLSFGVAGYFAFGDATEDIITLNLQDSTAALVVKLALCLGLYFTYPMMLFPAIQTLESNVACVRAEPVGLSPRTAAAATPRSVEARQNALRIALVMVTAFIAWGVPNFGLFMSLLGSSACSLLGFVLPAIFHLRIFRKSGGLTPLAALLDMLLIVVGVTAGFLGTVDSGRTLFRYYFGGADATLDDDGGEGEEGGGVV